ncbi:hypothetical protein QAD02_015423 [Eretmocerus hayati]|uniref:Uncharacterized protein n=1 Tax=Eretmocerus hayati TaxID=131215 RepID=A0ACC2P9G0_9HYME|nr:hypothetical protein QAD02_015423 [Eretmocerus hayati]
MSRQLQTDRENIRPKIAVVELRDPPISYEQQSYDFFPAYDFVFNNSRDRPSNIGSTEYYHQQHQQQSHREQYQWQPRCLQTPRKSDSRLCQDLNQSTTLSTHQNTAQYNESSQGLAHLLCDLASVNDTFVAFVIIALVLVVMIGIYVVIDLGDSD